MKNENTAKSAEKFPYINLNQSVPAVIYDFYQWWRHITYSTPWLSPEFPNDDARANLNALGAYLEKTLTDFVPQNDRQRTIKVKALRDMLHDAGLTNTGAFDPELLDDSGRIAYQISTQILQR